MKKSKRNALSWMIKKSKKCIKKDCYNNFIEDMGVYVIACEGKNKRYDKFVRKAKKAKLKACKITCVKGREFDDNFICELRDKKILRKSADMTSVEVAINMSHYNAWQSIVDSCLEYGLVFEDDAEIGKNFIDEINEIILQLKINNVDFSILHLYNGNWAKTLGKTRKVLTINNKIEILKETDQYNAGAAAYIISKKYAKYLMSKSFPIRMPQDILMGSYVKKGNHLTLRMKYDKKQECYKSPIVKIECGGEFGTGVSTTQTHDADPVRKIKC